MNLVELMWPRFSANQLSTIDFIIEQTRGQKRKQRNRKKETETAKITRKEP